MISGIMLLAVAGIAVRVLFVRDGHMRGTCASQTPSLNKTGEACTMCGRLPGEVCKEEKN
jgi:hypothetical protein